MAFSRLVASSKAWMPTRTLQFQILNPCHAIIWFCKSGPSWTPGKTGLLLSEEREQILRQDFHTYGSELETWHSGQRQRRSALARLCLFRLVYGESFRAQPPNQNQCVLPMMLTMVIFIKRKESAKVDLGTTLWGWKTFKGTDFTSFIFLSLAAALVALIHWSFSCWSYMSH